MFFWNRNWHLLVVIFFWLLMMAFIIFQNFFIFEKVIIDFFEKHAQGMNNQFQNEVVLSEQDNLAKINYLFSDDLRSKLLVTFIPKAETFFKDSNISLVKILDTNNNILLTISGYNRKNFQVADKSDREQRIYQVINYGKNNGYNKLMLQKMIYTDQDQKINVGYFIEIDTTIKKKRDGEKAVDIGYMVSYYDISDTINEMSFIRDTSIAFVLFLMILNLLERYFSVRSLNRIFLVLQDNVMNLQKDKLNAESEKDMKVIMLSNLCDEMNISIKSIITHGENIENEVFGEIKNKSYNGAANQIVDSANHLMLLSTSAIDYAKSSFGKLQINYNIFDVRKIITICINVLQAQAEKAGVKILYSAPQDGIFINADQFRLKQCILNILANSVRYTAKNGSINLDLFIDRSKKHDNLVIEIRDNGIGISNNILAKVNNDFDSIQEVVPTSFSGTGLGLPFTRYIIENMMGKFEIESKVGQGTCIKFIFKLVNRPLTQ
jgi:signal transduction histidine kinase